MSSKKEIIRNIENNLFKFVENKSVTILASGPSVENYKPTTDIIIVPNRSIVLPQLKDHTNVVWIVGTGWKRPEVLKWWIKKTKERTTDPKYMLVRHMKGFEKKYKIFLKIFQKILPNTIILPIPITTDHTNKCVSTGVECIHIAIQNKCSKIYIAGIEMGENTKYTKSLLQNKVIMEKGDDSFTRHLKNDINYLNNILKSEKNKNLLFPVLTSGLYNFINSKKKT